MRTVTICLFLLSALGPRAARAESVLFVHDGDTDPGDEGWFYWLLTSDPEVEAVADDDGFAAWSVRDDDGVAAALYRQDVSEAEVDAAEATGWRLRCRVRIVETPQASVGGTWIGYRSGSWSFQFHLGSTESGDPVIDPATAGMSPLTLEGAGPGYHLYELVYDPSAQTATLSVDGDEKITGMTGYSLSGDAYVAWGDGVRDDAHRPSHAHFNLVEFATDPAPPAPATLGATGDTYLKQGEPNQNQGSETLLRVRASGKNRALVAFDPEEIEDAVGSRTIARVRLRLFIEDNAENWGTSGRTVSAHRMLVGSTEGGATWNSPDDQDTTNSKVDGDSWTMGGNDATAWPFASEPTDSILHSNDSAGWVEWDVTADVAAFLSGDAANHGWLVRKDDEGAAGRVEYSSREGSNPPELVIEFE